jgi:glutamyl endopeptidase
MPNVQDKTIQMLYQQERASDTTQGRRRAGPRAVRASASLHTPVSSPSFEALARPAFGQHGPPRPETREVESRPLTRRPAPPSVRARGIDESKLLDAYWASFGDPGTRALLRSREDRSVLEVVIGADDRVEVGNTNEYPWRCIASLLMTAADGTNWIGTGWLVGPRILLTAGHCVFMADHGGWVSQMEVIPGRRGDERPFGSCMAMAFRSVIGWTESNDREFDYGAILLPADCRYGDQLGRFGYEVRADDDLENVLVNLSGYPGDKPVGTQWFHKNTITATDDRVITYQLDTAGGQSGAPVWVKREDGRYGVGIHTNGAVTGNSATRITQEVYDNITAWKNEVP